MKNRKPISDCTRFARSMKAFKTANLFISGSKIPMNKIVNVNSHQWRYFQLNEHDPKQRDR